MKIGKIIFFVVIIVLLIILGVFLWRHYNPDVGLVMFDEFEVKQTDDAKIISHPDTGFSVSIPPDWEIIDDGNSISFNSPDLEFDLEDSNKFKMPVPDKGCGMNFSVKKGDSGEEEHYEYDHVLGVIDTCSKKDLEFDCGYMIETVNSIKALKSISGNNVDELLGSRVRIQIPQNYNVYIFEAFLFGRDGEKCSGEFDKILQTVKIK